MIILYLVLIILIQSDGDNPSSYHRRIVLQFQSVKFSQCCLEVNEAVTSMSALIDVAMLFPRKVPSYNFSTTSELVDNLVGCYLKVNIMNINLMFAWSWDTFVVDYSIITILWRVEVFLRLLYSSRSVIIIILVFVNIFGRVLNIVSSLSLVLVNRISRWGI